MDSTSSAGADTKNVQRCPPSSNTFCKNQIKSETSCMHITNVLTYHRKRCSAKRSQCKVVEVMCSLGWFLSFF